MASFEAKIAETVRRAVFEDMLRAVTFTHGEIFHVIEDSDTDFTKLCAWYGNKNVFTTLNAAYAAVTTNTNAVIFLHGQTTHDLTEGIAWSKNRIHVIGLDGGDRLVQQGAKVRVTGATIDEAYVMLNTGVRNTFRNVKFIQGGTAATALTCVQFGGEGNAYVDCSFVFEVADNLDQTNAYEAVMGEDSGTFINCQFGADTLLTSAARSVMIIDQVTASQECKSNVFRDCTWLISSSSADAKAISMAAAGDILFTNHLIRPSFIASIDSAGGAACTVAVTTANGTTKGTILISYPMVHGFSDIGINGTNNDNLYVFSHVPSAADITSAKPTTT